VEVAVKLEKCRRKATEDTSVPVHTTYKEELSDILTRWYDMITEIPKYDNVKTRLSRKVKRPGHWAQSGREFENCISGRRFTSVKQQSFLLIDHTDDLQKIIPVFGWKDCEYLLRIGTCSPPPNGSFNKCPRQFAQLYSLHVDLGSTSHLNYEYPVVFAHLPSKKGRT
jgi:hypothetical protein